MSSFVKCFDVVSMAVGEASAQFAPSWKVDSEKYQILKQYCTAIDALSSEFDGESFEVEVDDAQMTIGIKMSCPGMLIKNKTHVYYSLAQRAISFGFSAADNGNVAVEFVFPSVWEKAV